MKRLCFALSILFLLAALAIPLLPAPALADSVLVDNDLNTQFDFHGSVATRAWYANGRSWVAYSKGTELFFTSSEDEVTWDARTSLGAVVTANSGVNVAVYFDGTYIHIVKKITGALQYRRAVPEGNGTFTYSADWQTIVSATNIGNPDITVDIYDQAWVVGGRGNDYERLWRNENTDGTWSTSDGFPHTVTDSWGYQAGVYSTGSGYTVVLYGELWSPDTLQARRWNGALQDPVPCPVEHAGAVIGSGYENFSATVVDDIIEIAFLEETTYDIDHVRFDCASNSWLDWEEIQHGATVNSSPLITTDGSGNVVYFWQNYPETDHIYYRWQDLDYGMSSRVDMGSVDLPVNGGLHNTSESVDLEHIGVYFLDTNFDLYYWGAFTEGETSAPVATAVDPADVTSTSATLQGAIIWDGGAPCTVYFQYAGGGQEGNLTVAGTWTTGEYPTVPATGLVPDNLYTYWMVATNAYGDNWGSLVHFYTLVEDEPGLPIVTTHAADEVSDTSAVLHGHLNYDGNTDGCAVGFQYRIKGAGAWTSVWNSVQGGYWFSDEDFEGTLSSLATHTTYEFKAQAKNAFGTVTGSTLEFTTGAVPSVTPEPSIPGIPNDWIDWLKDLASGYKIGLALLITVGSMILVGANVKSKAVGILVVAIGAAFVIVFTVLGWIPQYIVILVGGVIGLLLLLTIMGRKG